MSVTGNQPTSNAPTTLVRINGQDHQLSQEELIRYAQQGAMAAQNAEENRTLRAQLESTQADAKSWGEFKANMNADPQYMMGWLGERYGFSVNPLGASGDPASDDPPDEIAMLRQEVEQLRNTTQRGIQDTQRSLAVDRELSALKAKYPEADTNAILAFADANRMPEGTLEIAYTAMMAQQQPPATPPGGPEGTQTPPPGGTPPPPAPGQPNLAAQKLDLQGNVLPGQTPQVPTGSEPAAPGRTPGDPLHDGAPKPKSRSLRDSMDIAYQNNPDWDRNATPTRPENWW